MTLVAATALTKSYPGQKQPAVAEVSFVVESGELLALAGESGSGKSTLLRLLAGLEVPDAGEIVLDGRMIASPSFAEAPERRGIGLVFQHHALFPHLTVTQNIEFGIHRRSRTERQETVRSLLELVNLPGYERRYPHELSGGERQRVALARSLAPAPRLLLLDEPFSSLDARLRQEVRDETRAILKKHGTTAVFVTHDIQDALSAADRIVLLRQGRVQQEGAPPEVYRAPANAYVAGFFGPCNFLPFGAWPTDGDPLAFRAVGPPAKGEQLGSTQPSGVWVRPEDLTLAPEGETRGLSGRVEQVAFCGDRWEIRLRCQHDGNAFPLVVWQPTADGVSAREGEVRYVQPRRVL